MAERSFFRYMDAPTVSDSWVHWLIEASLDPKKKKEWFLSKLNNWLNDLKKDKKIFKKQRHCLARLTSDLPDSKRLVQKYPVFYKTVLPAEASADDLIGSFRCSGLKKMNTGPGLLVAMDVWREYLHLIVPDPADAYKSDYTDHAAWCKAVHELNQNTYTALLSRWRKKHNCRHGDWRILTGRPQHHARLLPQFFAQILEPTPGNDVCQAMLYAGRRQTLFGTRPAQDAQLGGERQKT